MRAQRLLTTFLHLLPFLFLIFLSRGCVTSITPPGRRWCVADTLGVLILVVGAVLVAFRHRHTLALALYGCLSGFLFADYFWPDSREMLRVRDFDAMERDFAVSLGLFMLCCATGCVGIGRLAGMIPRKTAADDARCAQCGYLLKGLESPRCPECGTPFDRYVSHDATDCDSSS